VIYGCLSMGVSFAAQTLEGTVLQASNSFVGSVTGPLTGMFVLGGLLSMGQQLCKSLRGVVSGAICGLGVCLWLSIGTYVSGIPLVELPHPNGTCFPDNNMTEITATVASITLATATLSLSGLMTAGANTTNGHGGRSGLDVFYSISYLWFSVAGTVIVVAVGLLVSFITGPNSIDDVPLKYQIPLFSRLCCCLPKSVLYRLNCYRYFDDSEV
ncbi:unnamed protein product, partial [Candidula unifasciata]